MNFRLSANFGRAEIDFWAGFGADWRDLVKVSPAPLALPLGGLVSFRKNLAATLARTYRLGRKRAGPWLVELAAPMRAA